MLTFKEYKDQAEAFGSSLEDRDDWLMLTTISQTRDSDHLTESNFAAALKTLGGESETCEVWRFGHWVCGWIEHLCVAPERRAEAQAILDRLEGYPVLDDDDFSRREIEAADEAWVSFGCREFADAMQNEFDLMDSTHDLLTKSPSWTLYVFENSEPYVLCTEGDTVRVRTYGGQTKMTRDQMAKALVQLRKEIRNV